jgi:hypothetical protein
LGGHAPPVDKIGISFGDASAETLKENGYDPLKPLLYRFDCGTKEFSAQLWAHSKWCSVCVCVCVRGGG